MKKTILYETESLYRDDFRVSGYEFGQGGKVGLHSGKHSGK